MPLLIHLICLLRDIARVFEDMKTLCRKYCYHELSEIDGVLNTSAPGSVVDEDELEYEHDEARFNLDIAAAEMGLRTDDLVAGLHDHHGGDQAMPIERLDEDLSDLEHTPEPDQRERQKGSHVSNAGKIKTQVSETSATETNTAVPSHAHDYKPQVSGGPAADTPAVYTSATRIQTSSWEPEKAKAPDRHEPEASTTESRCPAVDHQIRQQPIQGTVAKQPHGHALSQ